MSASIPEEVTGLTPNEVALIRRSWAKLMTNPAESGVTLLGLLLERYPEYIKLFPFRDVPQSEFKTNNIFREHAQSTANALNNLVELMDQSDLLVAQLAHVGYTHLKIKVTREAFLHFKRVIIDIFATVFEPEEIEAWKKALDVIFLGILSGLSAAEQFSTNEEDNQ